MQHRHFVECEIDNDFFKESVQELVESYTTQSLNPELDVSGSEVVDVAKAVVCAEDGGK